jgi:Tfp pilus assembly protein PilV
MYSCHMKKNQNGFGILEVLIIVIALIILVISGLFVASKNFTHNCSKKQNTALNTAQPAINDFNGTEIISGQPKMDSTVVKAGDCVDSEPYVEAFKNYSVSMPAGEAEDDITSTLAKQGYTKTKASFMSNKCGVNSEFNFTRNSTLITVQVGTVANDNAHGSCFINSNSITEDIYRQGAVNSIAATLNLPR